jgi:glutamyl-tRNA reductase
MSELLALGVSHKTAPISLRERVALPEGRAASVLRELVSAPEIYEAVALSTCNRTELYLAVGDDVEAETAALGILARQGEIRPTELVSHLYSLHNENAARHLFRVTAGLDAMIVGESEIQGQVKRAYELALVEGTTSAFMNRLFREALAAGKRVRRETQIGANSTSLSSVAVQLAQQTLGDLRGKRVIVIGAGETGELTARALTERGVRSVFVANRHYDRAIGLAQRFGGEAVRFDALPAQLELADIVVSSTSSPHHIVEREELASVMARRQGRALLLIDIAVPRDIDPAVADLEGVHLRDVDDLQRVVERNLSGREVGARHAEALLDHELARFRHWVETLEVVPTIAALHERSDAIVRQVLAENDGRWDSLSDADRERLELVAATIAKRLLHQPTLRLKEGGEDQKTYAYVQALRELFGLDSGAPSAFETADEPGRGSAAAGEGGAPPAGVTPIRRARGRAQR